MMDWKERKNKVIKGILFLFGSGMLYVFFIKITGFQIPCFFYLFTGLYCPGCGISRMCLFLLQFEFSKAFRANQLLFLCLPFFVIIALWMIYRYIRYGIIKTGKIMTGCLIIFIVLFLAFGIVRNLPGMEQLRPPLF